MCINVCIYSSMRLLGWVWGGGGCLKSALLWPFEHIITAAAWMFCAFSLFFVLSGFSCLRLASHLLSPPQKHAQ